MAQNIYSNKPKIATTFYIFLLTKYRQDGILYPTGEINLNLGGSKNEKYENDTLGGGDYWCIVGL